MAHLRTRHIIPLLKKQGAFWPVIGLLGLRQCGKSTLFRDFLQLGKYVTLDDLDAREDAELSTKTFLQKLPRPLVIDEVQRVPQLFDSIKVQIDQKRIPGSFYLTGSSQFSSKIGVRESLTGRIGLLYLYPLTLAETNSHLLEIKRAAPLHRLPPRYSIEEGLVNLESGGLPVPLFTRKSSLVKSYFQSWMETTLLRDAQRAYGKGYDSDVAYSVISQMGSSLKAGEYPTLKHFKQDSRKIRRYMQAFEDIFLVQKICPSEAAVGSDMWTFSDTGIASHVCGGILGEGTHLSLVRTFILKEVRALCEYSEKRIRLEFYKTSRSATVDFVWDGIPIKISVAPSSQIEYDLRSLRSSMRALKSKSGILMCGRDSVDSQDGIKMVPWVHYS